jgi:hypothetical protein
VRYRKAVNNSRLISFRTTSACPRVLPPYPRTTTAPSTKAPIIVDAPSHPYDTLWANRSGDTLVNGDWHDAGHGPLPRSAWSAASGNRPTRRLELTPRWRAPIAPSRARASGPDAARRQSGSRARSSFSSPAARSDVRSTTRPPPNLAGGIELIGGALRGQRAISTEPARQIVRRRPAFLGNARQGQNRTHWSIFLGFQSPRIVERVKSTPRAEKRPWRRCWRLADLA